MLRTIVDRARDGDEEAFAALVREVGDRCIFIAHRILRDANLAAAPAGPRSLTKAGCLLFCFA